VTSPPFWLHPDNLGRAQTRLIPRAVPVSAACWQTTAGWPRRFGRGAISLCASRLTMARCRGHPAGLCESTPQVNAAPPRQVFTAVLDITFSRWTQRAPRHVL